MTDERCIICGETEDGTPSAEAAHFQSPTHVHEYLPPSKAVRLFEVSGFSTERSDRAIVEAADQSAAFDALEARLKADDFEGMTDRAEWRAIEADRPLVYIHWWS